MNKQNKIEDIKQTVIYHAPIQKVWETVSTAEGIASWFMTTDDFQPIVGQEFHLQSPFGPSPCKVLEVSEPNLLKFSWDTDGWIVSFILKDLGNQKTEFTLIHGGWGEKEAIISKANTESSVIRDRMNHGWIDIVNVKLKKVVEI